MSPPRHVPSPARPLPVPVWCKDAQLGDIRDPPGWGYGWGDANGDWCHPHSLSLPLGVTCATLARLGPPLTPSMMSPPLGVSHATVTHLSVPSQHNSFQLQQIEEEVTSPTATVYR